ncbi:MAG: RsmE family RNA methyltransferase [bacterium]
MQRYFISDKEFELNIISSNDVFHISKVIRSKVNDKIIVCNNEEAHIVSITNITEKEVHFTKEEQLRSNELNTNITLLQGIPKGDKLDDIIMHSTELGVSNILIGNFIRSIAKIEEKKKEHKLTRFRKIAKEAAEQSHRNVIPNIEVVDYKKIDYTKYDLLVLLDEDEAKKIKSLNLKDVYNNQKNILFVVGPEGGIDSKERDFFVKNNFVLISLGKRILRTQTASLSFLSMLGYCSEE